MDKGTNDLPEPPPISSVALPSQDTYDDDDAANAAADIEQSLNVPGPGETETRLGPGGHRDLATTQTGADHTSEPVNDTVAVETTPLMTTEVPQRPVGNQAEPGGSGGRRDTNRKTTRQETPTLDGQAKFHSGQDPTSECKEPGAPVCRRPPRQPQMEVTPTNAIAGIGQTGIHTTADRVGWLLPDNSDQGVPYAQRHANGELCSPKAPDGDKPTGTEDHAGDKPDANPSRDQRDHAGKRIASEGKPGEGKLGLPGPNQGDDVRVTPGDAGVVDPRGYVSQSTPLQGEWSTRARHKCQPRTIRT